MNKHLPMITAGQFFILLFVSRLSLTMLYSSQLSGLASLWDLLLPLVLWIPVGWLLLWPSLQFGKEHDSVCAYSVRHFPKWGKGIPMMYTVYFFLSALYSLSVMVRFMNDVLPEGISSRLLLIILLLGCVYAAGQDIEAISRTAFLVFWLITAAVIMLTAFLMPGYSSSQLVPLRYESGLTLADGLLFLGGRMGTAVSLNVLCPSVKGSLCRCAKLYIIGFGTLVIGLITLFVGSSGDYLKNQQFQIFRAIDGSAVLQRLAPFFILMIVCSLFCHVTLLLLSMGYCIRTVFPHLTISKVTVWIGIGLAVPFLLWPDSDWFQWPLAVSAGLTVLCLTGIPAAVLIYRRVHAPKKTAVRTAKRKPKAALWLLVLTMVSSVFMGGCSSLQLNQRIIVQGIGVDRTQQGYTLTLLTLDTRDPQQDNAMKIERSEGKSVSEAVCALENRSGKKILLNHCLFVVMNRQAAIYTEKTLSYFCQAQELPKSIQLMVSEQEASETLCTATEEYGFRSEEINALSDSKAVNQSVVHCTLLDYIASGREQQEAQVLPYIALDEPTQSLTVRGGYLTEQTNGFTLSKEETVGYLLIKGTCGALFQEQTEAIAVSLQPSFRSNRLFLSVQAGIQWKAHLSAAEKHRTGQQIDTALTACLQKIVLQGGCDVFDIGQLLRNKEPYFLEKQQDMKALLRTADFTVTLYEQ